jgi:hypothetical protein
MRSRLDLFDRDSDEEGENFKVDAKNKMDWLETNRFMKSLADKSHYDPMKDFWDFPDNEDLDPQNLIDSSKRALFCESGSDELIGFFGRKLYRLNLTTNEIEAEVELSQEAGVRVSCVKVPRMNNRYTMIGFTNGKVQILLTETLEQKFEHQFTG